MVYCPECGVEINPDDIFCGNCGIALTPIVPIGEAAKNAPISEDEARDEESTAVQPASSDDSQAKDSFAAQNNSAPVQDEYKADKSSKNSFDDFSAASPKLKKEPEKIQDPIDKSSAGETPQSANSSANDWLTPTESVELPPLSTEKADETAKNSESANWQAEPLGESSNQKENESNQPISSVSEDWSVNPVTANNSAAQKQPLTPNFQSNDAADLSVSDAVNQKSQQDSPQSNEKVPAPDDYKPAADEDFQATLPYTPNDFAQQESLASKIAEENSFQEFEPNKLSPSDAEKFAVSENAAPIEPPQDVSVGSTNHESLEPKLVSVQIYNPKEKPEEVEPPTLLNSTDDVKAIVEQAKSGTETPVNRAFTSPNIGGSETDGKSKAKLKPLDDGTILNNRYEVVRKIGGGGMGAVYLASDRNLGGISRAVKEMVQSYIEDSQQEKAVNDFRRESMLLTSLEHPSIPTIYDYFFDDKEARFYLVMKYISGGDLAARLRSSSEGRIDEATVTEWGIQLADVLDYLHNRQPPIVYRDLKPSNIMIDGNTGKVMLIDFGIARWVNKEEKGVTAVGTMGYAPPELFSGNVEPRSDIYSLGSTMFHLLTGADPQSNPLLIFDFHKNPRPRQINSQLTDQMEQILMRMVEYNAEKRFGSAAELRNVLAEHLDNLRKGKITFGIAESSAASVAANQPVFCGFCGQKIMASDVFCPFCGAQQAAANKNQSAAFVAPRTTAKLVIIGTNELDSPSFNLEKDNNLIGRRDPLSNIFPEVDLSKFDPQTKISRRHARIWRDRGTFMVEDLGSSNGTTVINRNSESQKLAKNQPHLLSNGDKIRVGDTTLYFVSE